MTNRRPGPFATDSRVRLPTGNGPLAEVSVLPVQFRTAMRRDTPELRLCAAVLEDAWYRALRTSMWDPKGRQRTDPEREWFASTDRQRPFAFENLCDVLGLEPDAVRTQLRRQLPQDQAPEART